MASTQSTSTLPQGFSVYQPTLGAPLQFFPALGSQQLDDLINAFIPGPSPASEKRATISLDFLEYAQMTGQTFKFYPVHSAPSAATSPSTASPSVDSVNSSFNVSPIMTSWDWSATSGTSVASSSRGSTQRRRQSKTSSPPSRHQTTDFSHLPGMKILTKDGQDVTNSASRGSKTKEQRDHAHLMRIIKACDSCKRKKIRCDPSHKKRGVAQVTPQPAPKPAKKARTVPQDPPPCPPPATVMDPEMLFSSSSFDLDSTFDFSGLENLDPATLPYDPFEEFVQYPSMDASEFDFLLETGDYLSSQSGTSASSSSATPSSQQESGAPPGGEFINPDLQERSPSFPYLERSGSSSDYTDFNLFSPSSSFSEDERMLPIGSSTSSLPSLNEPSLSECPPPSFETAANGEAIEWNRPGLSIDELQFHSANESVGGSGHGLLNSSGGHATTSHLRTAGESANEYGSRLHTIPGSEPLSQVVICCPPGTVVIAGDASSGNQILDNVSTSFNSSAASVSLDVGASESPGVFVDQFAANATSNASSRISSVLPAEYVGQFTTAATNRNHSESPAESARQSAPVSTNRMDSESPGATTSNSDQDRLASVSSPASSRLESTVLSASTGDGLMALSSSNNRSSESIDDTNSAPGHERLTGLERLGHERLSSFERPVSERTSVFAGTSDRPAPSILASALEDCNDERLQPSTLHSRSTVAAGSSLGDLSVNDGGVAVSDAAGERSAVSHMTTRTAGVFVDQDDRSSGRVNDQGVSATQSTAAGVIQSSSLKSTDQPANASAFAADDNATNAPISSHNQPTVEQAQSHAVVQSGASLVSMQQTAAAVSQLALYVFAAAMVATNNGATASPHQPSRSSAASSSCRTMSRRSSLKQRTMFPTMSPLCVV